MSSELDWSPEYCLNCDKQTEGAYCSQACRLAEVERAAQSEQPATPLSTSASSTASYYSQPSTTQYSNQSHGFYLPPAVNFQSYQHSYQRTGHSAQGYVPSTSPTAQSYSYTTPQSPTYSSYTASSQASQSPPKRLTASSSHSSLGSVSAFQNGHCFSPRTTSTLHSYDSAFHQVKQSKQRYHRSSQS